MTRPEPAAEKVYFEVIVVQQRLFIRSESREPGTPSDNAHRADFAGNREAHVIHPFITLLPEFDDCSYGLAPPE
jgi:hypothetical protein